MWKKGSQKTEIHAISPSSMLHLVILEKLMLVGEKVQWKIVVGYSIGGREQTRLSLLVITDH